MATEFILARSSAHILKRPGFLLRGALVDKTWVVEIDADACSEATYESEFSIEGHAASIGSDDLSVLDFPRTENAQATYADHGAVLEVLGDASSSSAQSGAQLCREEAQQAVAAASASRTGPMGSPVGLDDGGAAAGLATLPRGRLGAPLASSAPSRSSHDEARWVVVDAAQASSSTFRPRGRAWVSVAPSATALSLRRPPTPAAAAAAAQPPQDATPFDVTSLASPLLPGADLSEAPSPVRPPSAPHSPVRHSAMSPGGPLRRPLSTGSLLLAAQTWPAQSPTPHPLRGTSSGAGGGLSRPGAPCVGWSSVASQPGRPSTPLLPASANTGVVWQQDAREIANAGADPLPLQEEEQGDAAAPAAAAAALGAVAGADAPAPLHLPATSLGPLFSQQLQSPMSPPPGTIRPPTASRRNHSPGPAPPQQDTALEARGRSGDSHVFICSQPAAQVHPLLPALPAEESSLAPESPRQPQQPHGSLLLDARQFPSPPRGTASRGVSSSAFSALVNLAPPTLSSFGGGSAFGAAHQAVTPGRASASTAAVSPVPASTLRPLMQRDAGPVRVFNNGLAASAAPLHFAVTAPGGGSVAAASGRQSRAGAATPPRLAALGLGLSQAHVASPPPSHASGTQQQQRPASSHAPSPMSDGCFSPPAHHSLQPLQGQSVIEHSPPSPAPAAAGHGSSSGAAAATGGGGGMLEGEETPSAARRLCLFYPDAGWRTHSPPLSSATAGAGAPPSPAPPPPAPQLQSQQQQQRPSRSASASSAAFFSQLLAARPPSTAAAAATAASGSAAVAGAAALPTAPRSASAGSTSAPVSASGGAGGGRPSAPGPSAMGAAPPDSPALAADLPLSAAVAAPEASAAPPAAPAAAAATAPAHSAITNLLTAAQSRAASSMDTGAVVGIVIGAILLVAVVACVVVCLKRRKRLTANFSLDASERRFKRRLDRQMQEIDDIFEDDEETDVSLSAKDIEQLQLLEQELARRSKEPGRAAAAAAAVASTADSADGTSEPPLSGSEGMAAKRPGRGGGGAAATAATSTPVAKAT